MHKNKLEELKVPAGYKNRTPDVTITGVKLATERKKNKIDLKYYVIAVNPANKTGYGFEVV